MRLVLFDIDGTLITDGGAAREAFHVALHSVYGYRGDLGQFDFSGLTDPEIARMVLRAEGFDDETIDRGRDDLWSSYLDELERRVPGRVRALRGIEVLLVRLAGHEEVVLGLLTGNIERGARLKLGAADLNRYFPFGAFGSDSPVRSELPPIAMKRASSHANLRLRASDIVIIGDSIHDVRCAAPHRAKTIAVASGRTTVDLLRKENPHYLFDSADDCEAILAAILE